jgi:hypothetical protein
VILQLLDVYPLIGFDLEDTLEKVIQKGFFFFIAEECLGTGMIG